MKPIIVKYDVHIGDKIEEGIRKEFSTLDQVAMWLREHASPYNGSELHLKVYDRTFEVHTPPYLYSHNEERNEDIFIRGIYEGVTVLFQGSDIDKSDKGFINGQIKGWGKVNQWLYRMTRPASLDNNTVKEIAGFYFYDKSSDEGFILHILNKHKIYDLMCEQSDDGKLMLYGLEEPTDLRLVNEEIFDFLLKDVFAFDGDTVPLLTDEEADRFFMLKEKYVSPKPPIAERGIVL